MNTWKKKVSLVLLGLGLVVLGSSKPASAANPVSINVTVTVDFLSVSVASSTWAIGQVAANSTNLSGAIGVTNNGNRQVDYNLALQYSGGWSVSASNTPAADTFALLGLFTTTPQGTLVDAQFGATNGTDDIIVVAGATASSTNFAITNEALSAKGTQVAGSAVRQLMLDFRAPTSNTQSTQQSMTVVVTAQ